jgi:glycine cleavage system protein P-like pyridoxal-binding family
VTTYFPDLTREMIVIEETEDEEDPSMDSYG